MSVCEVDLRDWLKKVGMTAGQMVKMGVQTKGSIEKGWDDCGTNGEDGSTGKGIG